MKLLGPVTLDEVLFQWSLHECKGRLSPHIPPEPEVRSELTGPDRRFHAIRILLQVRQNVVAAILAASPVDSHHIEVSSVDIPTLRVMGGEPLTTYAERTAAATDESGEWVRELISRPANVEGPLLGVARQMSGPWTLLDGLHRAAAWTVHGRVGRDYPVRVNLVVTRFPATQFE